MLIKGNAKMRPVLKRQLLVRGSRQAFPWLSESPSSLQVLPSLVCELQASQKGGSLNCFAKAHLISQDSTKT